MTEIQFEFGPETIESYRRLSYKPWHALAEFVDNSTQSFFNNRDLLEKVLSESGDNLRVDIAYDRGGEGCIRISDNAMGMDLDELRYAVRVGARPENDTGRSRYGMGLKTAACWFGNSWTIRTKKLGEPAEYEVSINVQEIAQGNSGLNLVTREAEEGDHYTILEIRDLNRHLHGRTLGKVRDFLSSMYRIDLDEGWLDLYWDNQPLEWKKFTDDDFSKDSDGNLYKKDFEFDIDGKKVSGWVGVLAGGRGSRSKAGFAVLHANRVVMGWPESWRPSTIFGQHEGSNNLINQRVCGEIRLDNGFEVSQAKDDIHWTGNEEELVEEELLEVAKDYIQFAKDRRTGDEDSRGPTEVEIKTAVEELVEELSSSELADMVLVEDIPDPEVIQQGLAELVTRSESASITYSVRLSNAEDGPEIQGRLSDDLSPNDPYFQPDFAQEDTLIVVINRSHPHFKEVAGAAGVLNYLRDCTYDALAEWKATKMNADLQPKTLRQIKDSYLRVGMQIDLQPPPAD